MTSPDATAPRSAPLVAAEIRAEMARQQKTVTDLAAALGLKDPKSARARYVGVKPYDLDEVDRVATWLGVERARLLAVEPAVA